MAKNALVAYFSAGGNTAKVASLIAEVANADLFEIRPEVPYTKADLDYMDKGSRTTVEMNDKASRPAMAGTVEDMDEYDVVFLGFPIWWYTAPRIVNSFLEAYDFSGKTVVCFATSGGSRMGDTVKELSVSAPDANFVDGGVLPVRSDEEAIDEWIEELEL